MEDGGRQMSGDRWKEIERRRDRTDYRGSGYYIKHRRELNLTGRKWRGGGVPSRLRIQFWCPLYLDTRKNVL